MAGLAEALAALVLARADRPGWVLGLSGAQGSGKSTLAANLAGALAAAGRSCAVLSLDDVYLGPEAKGDGFASTRPIDQSQFRGPKREGTAAKWSPVD